MSNSGFHLSISALILLFFNTSAFSSDASIDLEPFYRDEIDRIGKVGECLLDEVLVIKISKAYIFVPNSYFITHEHGATVFRRMGNAGALTIQPYPGRHSFFERGLYKVIKEYEKFGLKFVLGESASNQPENFLVIHNSDKQVAILEYWKLLNVIESEVRDSTFWETCELKQVLEFGEG